MRTLFICLMIALGTIAASAQTTVNESLKSMSDGIKNALTIDLSGVEVKVAEKVWREYLKSYDGKLKKDRKSKDWVAEEVRITAIGGSSPILLTTRFEQIGEDVLMSAWFNMGSYYLASERDMNAYNAGTDLLDRFAYEVSKEKVRIELADQEKLMKDLEAELKKLEKANEGYHKEIEQAQERIRKAEEAIAQNIKDQEAAKTKIMEQGDLVNEVKERLGKMQ